jgi:hypothetical protein
MALISRTTLAMAFSSLYAGTTTAMRGIEGLLGQVLNTKLEVLGKVMQSATNEFQLPLESDIKSYALRYYSEQFVHRKQKAFCR